MTIIQNFEKRLDELISHSEDSLSKAIRYATFGGGKRLRPQLLFATLETFDQDPLLGLDPACAIEMVHTYSLIHDDLPCMDNDDFRRSRPTVHRMFSEGMAVLAGDALLTEAFAVVAKSPKINHLQTVRLIALLAKRCGKDGMVEGQAIDIESNATTPSLDQLKKMDQKKTGDLFSLALEFGAIIANADEKYEKLLRQLGMTLGLAYQIQDDLEDLPSKELNKITFVSILGKDAALNLLNQTIDESKEIISFLPHQAPSLNSMIQSKLFNKQRT